MEMLLASTAMALFKRNQWAATAVASVLIRSLAGTEVVLLVVGDGPARKKLEKLAADLNVDAVFLGERRDAEK